MKRPWSHQSLLKKQKIPSQGELLAKINQLTLTQLRALISLAYLTGGRITEIVKCKNLQQPIFEYESTEPKRIKRDSKGRPFIKEVKKIELNYPGVCKKDIDYSYIKTDEGDKRVMTIDVQNRKNKKIERKTIPILIHRENEFVEIIEEYIKDLDYDTPLFDFGRSWAYQLIRKHMNLNCHFLRDIRATHLVTIHGLKEFQLVMFMGWADARPASRYVRMRWQDIWR